MKKGDVSDTWYVYRDGAWTEADGVESVLGSCTASDVETIKNNQGTYYVCEDIQWKSLATLEEADTYGWIAGTIGEVKKGNITDAKYVYRNSKWNAASTVESALGSCTTKNAGTVSETGSVYYICKSSSWTRATALEYDSYGYTCSKDGSIVSGAVNADNKYVCDGGSFRTATTTEINLELGCTSYTQGKKFVSLSNSTTAERWMCWDEWKYQRFIYIADSRDNQVYGIVTIGSQTWMAENLNYDYNEGTAKSYCYLNKADSCAKYGRLYTWAAAMDSAGAFSTAGEGCGYWVVCNASGVVRGVCPEGWHLPSQAEFKTLMNSVGGSSVAATKLKSTYGWKSGNGTDDYGFSALPAGYYNSGYYNGGFRVVGSDAYVWSATEDDVSYALYWDVNAGVAYLYGCTKGFGYSVRCLKDSN